MKINSRNVIAQYMSQPVYTASPYDNIYLADCSHLSRLIFQGGYYLYDYIAEDELAVMDTLDDDFFKKEKKSH